MGLFLRRGTYSFFREFFVTEMVQNFFFAVLIFANLFLICEDPENVLCQIKAHGQNKKINSAIVEENQGGYIVRFSKLRLSVGLCNLLPGL